MLRDDSGIEQAVAPTVFHGFSFAADLSRFITANLTPSTDIPKNIENLKMTATTAASDASKAFPYPDMGDVASKIIGLPKPLAIVVALLSLYALGVGAGILPPLKKVFK
jgi:hypothetical protein